MMYELPITIEIGGEDYNIRNKGDYRMVLDCFKVCNDLSLTIEERTIASLIIFYADLSTVEDVGSIFKDKVGDAVKKMYDFFNCNQPDFERSSKNYNLIDWDLDAMLITAGINKVAGREIRNDEYCHWWTFMSYYMSIGEGLLSTVVGIRHKIMEGKPLDKYEKQYRRDNPQFFNRDMRTQAQKENEAYIRSIWNSNS